MTAIPRPDPAGYAPYFQRYINLVPDGDATELPGMDETAWAAASNADRVPLADLLDELLAVRRATTAFFRNLDAAALDRAGVASGNTLTVACLAWLAAGHEIHHAQVIRERYR